MRESNLVVQSLWIGDRLGIMEQLSIRSFQAHGHEFHLYVYGKIKGIPTGVKVYDANEIIDLSTLHYSDFPRLALFADFFRYKLLLERGGWWVDLDTVCLQPFDFGEEYVFSSEWLAANGGLHVNNGNIKVPKRSAVMEWCWEQCKRLNPKHLSWGQSGPKLIQQAVAHFDLKESVQPPATFCPIDCWETQVFTAPKECERLEEKCEGAYAVHLWNDFWHRLNLNKFSAPNGSFYRSLLKKYGVETTEPQCVVRLHMEMPFAAINGLYSGLTKKNLDLLVENGVELVAQSPIMARDLSEVWTQEVRCLSTDYTLPEAPVHRDREGKYVDVALLGALRVLKNPAVQAVAALGFARECGKKLRLHVNDYADEVYNTNVRSLLEVITAAPDAELVVHPWLDHDQLLKLLKKMTIGLQVSMTESANNTALDMLAAGLPMVGSREIKWLHPEVCAHPTDAVDIRKKMHYALKNHHWLYPSHRCSVHEQNCLAWHHWKQFLCYSKKCRVLFLVQSSPKKTGVQLASEQDCAMLRRRGIEAEVVQTTWKKSELQEIIGKYQPTHVIGEGCFGLLSLFEVEEESPKEPKPERVVSAPKTDWEDALVGKKIKKLQSKGFRVTVCEPESDVLPFMRNKYPDAIEECVSTTSGKWILFCVTGLRSAV